MKISLNEIKQAFDFLIEEKNRGKKLRIGHKSYTSRMIKKL